MVYNFINLPITIFFIANGFGQLYYALKLRKKFPEDHNLLNSFIVFILWILAGILYPLFYIRDNYNIRWFQSLSVQIICIYAPLLVFFILFYQYQIILKKDPMLKMRRTIENFKSEFELVNNQNKNSKKAHFSTDLHRKSFHLIPAIVIILLWFFAVEVWDNLWNADLFWGITGEEYAIFLILTVGYTGIIIFAALDYVRLSYIFENRTIYHLMPKNVSNLLIKTLKPIEIYEFTKPVALIVSLVPIFFFLPFGIFAAVALIASIGDGAASIFGIRFGRIHFPKNSEKTVIGYIAGFLCSLGIGYIILGVFESSLYPLELLLVSFSGAIVFLIIDLLSPKIDDNILNPIFCALAIFLVYSFLTN